MFRLFSASNLYVLFSVVLAAKTCGFELHLVSRCFFFRPIDKVHEFAKMETGQACFEYRLNVKDERDWVATSLTWKIHVSGQLWYGVSCASRFYKQNKLKSFNTNVTWSLVYFATWVGTKNLCLYGKSKQSVSRRLWGSLLFVPTSVFIKSPSLHLSNFRHVFARQISNYLC